MREKQRGKRDKERSREREIISESEKKIKRQCFS